MIRTIRLYASDAEIDEELTEARAREICPDFFKENYQPGDELTFYRGFIIQYVQAPTSYQHTFQVFLIAFGVCPTENTAIALWIAGGEFSLPDAERKVDPVIERGAILRWTQE